jgi:hypothetical protein
VDLESGCLSSCVYQIAKNLFLTILLAGQPRTRDYKAHVFSIYASPRGAGEEVVRAVEDMVKDQGYSDGTLHNSIVNVMFWINQKMNTIYWDIRGASAYCERGVHK